VLPACLREHGLLPQFRFARARARASRAVWCFHTHAGLQGQPPRRGITLEEVARHCTEADAWTVLGGRVYNMTAYLRFHPGGVPLLMRIAGRDGSALFDKYHPWVNAGVWWGPGERGF
jgi:cytochrome b involved in lipid metabolism